MNDGLPAKKQEVLFFTLCKKGIQMYHNYQNYHNYIVIFFLEYHHNSKFVLNYLHK